MSILLLLLLGGWQISLGNLTSSEFVSYVSSVGFLIDPIAHITSNYNEFKQGEASVDRVFELIAIQPTVREKPDAIALPPQLLAKSNIATSVLLISVNQSSRT